MMVQIRARNLEPALKWAEEHRDKISKDGSPSRFEFQLHRLAFLHILRSKGQGEALHYCKTHFSHFTKDHMPEIQRLAGHLIYAKHATGKSPYKDTYDQQWEEVATDFVKQACNLVGQVTHITLSPSSHKTGVLRDVGTSQSSVGDDGCRIGRSAGIAAPRPCHGKQWT